jgi:hypothetical protein
VPVTSAIECSMGISVVKLQREAPL